MTAQSVKPTMENPYARLRKAAGYSAKDFCAAFQFSKQTLISVETGRYPTISDRLKSAIGKACREKSVDVQAILSEYRSDRLSGAYDNWQYTERVRQAKGQIAAPGHWTTELSPMHFVVKGTASGSLQGFATLLRIASSPLIQYISGKQREMPAEIKQALIDIEYPYLEMLDAMQDTWNKAR